MANKFYEVLKGQKYTGKHRVYMEGDKFAESELFGNDESRSIAIEGAKEVKSQDGKSVLKPAVMKKIKIAQAVKK